MNKSVCVGGRGVERGGQEQPGARKGGSEGCPGPGEGGRVAALGWSPGSQIGDWPHLEEEDHREAGEGDRIRGQRDQSAHIMRQVWEMRVSRNSRSPWT